MTRKMILNDGPAPPGLPAPEVAGRLRSDINRLKTEFYDLARGRVDYDAMRGSDAYAQYAADAAMLHYFDPGSLKSRGEQLAFWVNLYNALVIHGVIELGLRESVKERPDFFRSIAYAVGGQTYTPDDIEHGILRGNNRPPHGLLRPFGQGDPRLDQVVDPPDPRIHFVLVCASASCPLINFYSAERLEEQFLAAAAGFVNGPEVEILPHDNLLRLSPIFKWYRPDFGGHEGMIDTLIRYLDLGPAKDFLIERGMAADVEWKDYDWRLNR